MEKAFHLFLVLLMVVFTIPVNGFIVKAEGASSSKIADGIYELDVNYWKSGTNKSEKSVAGDYMSDKAELKVDDGVYELTLINNTADMVIFTKFELDGVSAISEKKEGKEYFTFILSELKTDYQALLDYEVPAIGFVHPNVPMDVELLGLENLPKKSDSSDPDPQPGEGDGDSQEPGVPDDPEQLEPPGDDEEPQLPEQPDEPGQGDSETPEEPEEIELNEGEFTIGNPSTNNGDAKNDDQTNEKPKVCKDGEYIIPVEVLKADSNDASVTNDYIKNNHAKLIVKDGTFKVQLTLTNASWWEAFKVQTSEGYKDVRVISEDSAKDERVVEFDVADPNEIIPGKIHIIVKGIPGFHYDNNYDIRIKLDTSGVDLSDCVDLNRLNANAQLGDTNHVDGLAFDRDAEGSKGRKSKEEENVLNPKTADKSQIALYSSLLIASFILLAYEVRKKLRTVN